MQWFSFEGGCRNASLSAGLGGAGHPKQRSTSVADVMLKKSSSIYTSGVCYWTHIAAFKSRPIWCGLLMYFLVVALLK